MINSSLSLQLSQMVGPRYRISPPHGPIPLRVPSTDVRGKEAGGNLIYMVHSSFTLRILRSRPLNIPMPYPDRVSQSTMPWTVCM